MAYLRDRVIVLKKEPYREHDRRYVMFGHDYGLLSAVARGASSPKSKQAGHLEPFTEAEVMIAKGSAFDKLAVARMVGGQPIVHNERRLAAFAIMGSFADLVIRLSRPGISDERIFILLKELIDVLARLPADPSADRARLVFAAATLKLLDVIGFGPAIECDQVQVATMLKFMRGAALADVLRVTAAQDVFQQASAFVEASLQHAPLDAEPHGVRTIGIFLS